MPLDSALKSTPLPEFWLLAMTKAQLCLLILECLDSVEILDPESGEGWKPGKYKGFDYAVVLILVFSKSFFEFRS